MPKTATVQTDDSLCADLRLALTRLKVELHARQEAFREANLDLFASIDQVTQQLAAKSGLPAPLQRLIELDQRKPEINAFSEELTKTLEEAAALVGVGGYFEASDGTVFKLTAPKGRYVYNQLLGYDRTKREGEIKGTLAMKEAQEARANGLLWQPAPPPSDTAEADAAVEMTEKAGANGAN